MALVRCDAYIWYPIQYNDGEPCLTCIWCPMKKGHEGLHRDENLYPFFSDEDARWFNDQYEVLQEVGHGLEIY